MSSKKIGPASLTLRAKNERTTILMFALATDTLQSLKQQIHRHLADNSAHMSALLTESPGEVVLGLPRDSADLSKGFEVIADQDKKVTTVASVGLRDGGVLAWKRDGGTGGGGGEDSEFAVEIPKDEDEEEEGGDDHDRMKE